MKAIGAILLILALAVYIHTRDAYFLLVFWRPGAYIMVGAAILVAAIPLGWRNVLNAFRGKDQEAGKRIIQTLACTGIITVVFGISGICHNLSTPDNIGPIAMRCLATIILATAVSLFLVLNAKRPEA
jgi:hypothetical protein